MTTGKACGLLIELDGLLAHSIGTEASCLIPVDHALSSLYGCAGLVILLFQLVIR